MLQYRHLLNKYVHRSFALSFRVNTQTQTEDGIVIRRSEAGPHGSYELLVTSGAIQRDEYQYNVLSKLHNLYEQLTDYSPAVTTTSKWFSFLKRNATDNKPLGMYLYGSVGCGKTMLMDMFFENVKLEKKKRVHFNQFMIDVHKRIHQFKLSAPPPDHRSKTSHALDPILPVADAISEELSLICFDEFQVTDVADALILRRLFTKLFDNGIIMVATSNRPPDDLYKNGLQRSNFIPFIPILKKNCDVVHIQSGIDYRRLDFEAIGEAYLDSTLPETKTKMELVFKKLCDNEIAAGKTLEPRTLVVFGRDIVVDRACGNVAFCTFDELCMKPRGAGCYIGLTKEFHTIVIEHVPSFRSTRKVEMRRFITMIDNFYDNKTRVVISAERPAAELFVEMEGNSLELDRDTRMLMDDLQIKTGDTDVSASLFTAEEEIFAFDRTVSRLTEMQTVKYWEQEKSVS